MRLKTRRLSVVVIALLGVLAWVLINPQSYDTIFTPVENTGAEELTFNSSLLATEVL